MCNVNKQSNVAKVLKECELIFQYESSMSHKKGLHALNNGMKDQIILMGGDTVLFAGGFRQSLQDVPIGTRSKEVEACIKSSYPWPQTIKLSLNKNMQVHLIRDSTDG